MRSPKPNQLSRAPSRHFTGRLARAKAQASSPGPWADRGSGPVGGRSLGWAAARAAQVVYVKASQENWDSSSVLAACTSASTSDPASSDPTPDPAEPIEDAPSSSTFRGALAMAHSTSRRGTWRAWSRAQSAAKALPPPRAAPKPSTKWRPSVRHANSTAQDARLAKSDLPRTPLPRRPWWTRRSLPQPPPFPSPLPSSSWHPSW
mmetsp:Transcript_51804/g.118018  ORF Transcript_51804/g.118018 Transcript_51804/m.118018 type:complete len:205 (-) Transcript_51804:1414-2028(-)